MNHDYENIGPPYVLLVEQEGTIFGIYGGNAPVDVVLSSISETEKEPSSEK